MTLLLEGQANDYVGKGLSGGDPGSSTLEPTGSRCGAAGHSWATSRFVRCDGGLLCSRRAAPANALPFAIPERRLWSKAWENTGCEYMTGGVVVILGATGRNFGAGMTGGVAYVWDLDGSFQGERRFNSEFVEVHRLADCICSEPALVRELVRRHVDVTGSRRGKQLLENWEHALTQILRVAPKAVDLPKPPGVR